jgi:hypothetical protein
VSTFYDATASRDRPCQIYNDPIQEAMSFGGMGSPKRGNALFRWSVRCQQEIGITRGTVRDVDRRGEPPRATGFCELRSALPT